MKKNKKLAIVVGAVLALCLIAAGIFGMTVNSAERKLAKQLEIGQRYLDEMDYEQAIVAFEQAIAIDPKCEDAYHGMAVAYAGMGEYENSLENFDKLLELGGENERVLDDLDGCLREYADVLLREKRYDEIKDLAEKYGNLAVGVFLRHLLEEAEGSGEAGISANEESEAAGVTDAEPIQVTVKRTEIQADSVTNLEGYGCLTIKGVGNWVDNWEDPESIIPPQTALIDADGNFVFPYKSTYLRYYISDGIVSLTESSPYSPASYYYGGENNPAYYNIDGSSVFVPESATNKVDDHVVETIEWDCGFMRDGYALVNKHIYMSFSYSDSAGVGYEIYSYIIDRSGAITCTLPEGFNVIIADGDPGYYTKYSLGRCGEGLFAVFENSLDDDWYISGEAKGYMDPVGNMVLDLSGRGFTDLWPFHEGLAAVQSESGIGFIDKTGALVIPCIYDGVIAGFGEDGITAVKKDGKWGYIGRDGNVVIPCIYDDIISNFSEDGITAVKKDGKWGYIGRDGNIAIPFEYDSAYGAVDGLATVVKDGKCGLVDYRNRIIVPLEYDDISSCEGGTGYVIKDGVVYIISKF